MSQDKLPFSTYAASTEADRKALGKAKAGKPAAKSRKVKKGLKVKTPPSQTKSFAGAISSYEKAEAAYLEEIGKAHLGFLHRAFEWLATTMARFGKPRIRVFLRAFEKGDRDAMRVLKETGINDDLARKLRMLSAWSATSHADVKEAFKKDDLSQGEGKEMRELLEQWKPNVTNTTLYRGMRLTKEKLEDYESLGYFSDAAPSSYSLNKETARDYYITKGSTGKEPLLVVYEEGSGYDISKVSIHPDENEVVIPPKELKITEVKREKLEDPGGPPLLIIFNVRDEV